MESHVNRPLIYFAGPYQFPDPVENSHRTIKAADRLMRTGLLTAYVPHLSLLWHIVEPHDADWWYDYDLAVLARCDGLLRLPGRSIGADNEILFAESRAIPVYRDPFGLLKALAQ